MKFYEFSQNNSGGSFIVNDQLCHRLIIEAKNERSANQLAENAGCYWNGVEVGQDCPCCGDRWYAGGSLVDLETINVKWKGYEISEWLPSETKGKAKKQNTTSQQTVADEMIRILKKRYEDMTWLEEPKVKTHSWGAKSVTGRLRIDHIEQYAQLMADIYGWTKPDVRIFYADGTVKEIFSKKNHLK